MYIHTYIYHYTVAGGIISWYRYVQYFNTSYTHLPL